MYVIVLNPNISLYRACLQCYNVYSNTQDWNDLGIYKDI